GQRGILEHDFGVSQYKVHWYMERTEELSHGGATGFTPPPGISFQRIPPDKSMASMLVNNELDAAAINSPWKNMPNVIGRSHRIPGADGDWSKVKLLFTDRFAEGKRFFQKWGFLPVNHTYTIRGDIYNKYPWAAFNLYTAFVKAKAHFNAKLVDSIPLLHYSNLKRIFFTLFVASTLASLSCVQVATAKPITLAYRTPTLGSNLPIFVATELGLFAAENLEVKTVFIQGGPTAMAALIGGDVDYIKVAGVPAVRAIAQGTPLVIAGGFQPYIDYTLIGSK